MKNSRREFLGTGLAAMAVAATRSEAAAQVSDTFWDILRPPDFAAVYVEGTGRITMSGSSERWQAGDVEVTAQVTQQGSQRTLAVSLASPRSPLERVQLRWEGRLPEDSRFLGDHWERAYGDLEWRGFAADRVMPWYFLVATKQGTHGYGVKTGANAFCFWQADSEGISLWLDVRNGGSGVRLGERQLAVAEVVALRGGPDIPPFHSAGALCRTLAERPRLPAKPIYGSNNWYYLYGENMTAASVLRDVDQLAELAPVDVNPPYMVIDMGWCKGNDGAGPWTEEHLRFPEVPSLPAEMKKRGVRAGIWVRPLLTSDPRAQGFRLARDSQSLSATASITLDPSMPEALAYIQEGLRRIRGWGYELVKHDFSSFDILGRWGMEMGAELTSAGWYFADRTKTTAEIVVRFYRAIREAVGEGILLGCNTVGHLGAGIFEAQRGGDDTSGPDWNRTRKMGVNTLGFRLPQHRAFFLLDPDCASFSKTVPLSLDRQWLDIVARSGTVLFVSADPAQVTPEQKQLLKAAFAAAARVQPEAEPLDWMKTTTPQRWRLAGKTTDFNWFGKDGVDFFAK